MVVMNLGAIFWKAVLEDCITFIDVFDWPQVQYFLLGIGKRFSIDGREVIGPAFYICLDGLFHLSSFRFRFLTHYIAVVLP
jgi:hypothetical protein